MHDDLALQELSASYHFEPYLHPRDNTRLRISGIGSCTRQLYYRIKHYRDGIPEPPIWTHGRTIFETGHAMHLILQQRLSNAGPLRWVDADPVVDGGKFFGWDGNFELNFRSDEHGLEGHCDALTRPLVRRKVRWQGKTIELMEPTDDEDEGTRYIIDFKTITARERVIREEHPYNGTTLKLDTQPSAFERLHKPKTEHISQTSLYAYLSTQPGFQARGIPGPLKKLPQVMIVYVAKDLDPKYYGRYEDYEHPEGLLNAPFKIFTEPVSLDHVDTLLAKARKVHKAVEAGKPPAKDYYHKPDRPAWNCVGCSFRSTCYEAEGYFSQADPPVPDRLRYLEQEQVPALLGESVTQSLFPVINSN